MILIFNAFFEDRLNLFAQLPFSRKVRIEAGASFSLYYDRLDRTSTFYQAIPAGNSFSEVLPSGNPESASIRKIS
ncbi:MAG: hypothetical protein HC912_12660 [Saprospiraceae bacterium]|nr:hypothetical protein [Saprospiraceae bacterium]